MSLIYLATAERKRAEVREFRRVARVVSLYRDQDWCLGQAEFWSAKPKSWNSCLAV